MHKTFDIYVLGCMLVCGGVYILICAIMWGGIRWSWLWFLRKHCFPFFGPKIRWIIFARNSLSRPEWLSSEPQWSAWLWIPNAVVTRMHYHMLAFATWIRKYFSMFARQMTKPSSQTLTTLIMLHNIVELSIKTPFPLVHLVPLSDPRRRDCMSFELYCERDMISFF